ncbi:MAG: glycosyltransferase family 2 protein, partial [Ramlibacter sp.]|nr:glycosyltransferase family 2 protein [Ramlibacter sp.]
NYVLIVNYRTGTLVVDCLASLVSELPSLQGGRVIVVDNASGDDSMEHIGAAIKARGWGNWAELIALPRNGGFAYGNNRALERVRALDPAFGAIVCLNPDATVRPGALAALLGQFGVTPQVGIVGALIEDERGVQQRAGHNFPSPLGELERSAQLGLLTRALTPREVLQVHADVPRRFDWVSGACFAVRREVIDQIGAFDEGYFLYFEETDFCLRAQRAGWSCWHVPQAEVVHLEGASTGINVSAQRRPPYWYASRRRYFLKAYGVTGLFAADLLWAIGRCSLVLRRGLGLGGLQGQAREPRKVFFDLLVGDLRALLKGEWFGVRDGLPLRSAPPSAR